MGFFELLVIATGLAMDAFAVTISDALAYPNEPPRRLFWLPVSFGVFQGLMPLFGYLLANVAAQLVEAYAGIVALVVLGAIGLNMIFEGLRAQSAKDVESPEAPRLLGSIILLQSIATAIDAFAIGISLRAFDADIFVSVCTIGVVTFLFCCVAVALGKRLGPLFGWKAQVVGGVVLICIGIRAFFS